MTFIQYSINKQKKSYGREKQTSTHKRTTNIKRVGHNHTTYIIMVDSQQTNRKYVKKKRCKKVRASP